VEDWVQGNGHRQPLPPPGTGRRRSLIILVGLLVALPAAFLLSVGRGDWRPVATVAELEDEDVIYRRSLRLFVVHGDRAPMVLSALTPGGGDRVVYCRFADAFQDADGAVFDRLGSVLAGSVSRGLDRFPVRVRVGVVEVDVSTRVSGPPRPEAAEDVSANLCRVPGPEDPPGFATIRATPAT
jgi:hypothetical protein